MHGGRDNEIHAGSYDVDFCSDSRSVLSLPAARLA
jgi:hypothetical protein